MSRDKDVPTSQRPIGFWIKSADQALDRAIDAIHAENDFTRRRWQVLSLIAQAEPVSLADLIERFAPMLDGDVVREEVSALEQRQIIIFDSGRLETTDFGRELHGSLAEKQAAFRRKAMEGISEADYRVTVQTLSTIVENVAGQESAIRDLK